MTTQQPCRSILEKIVGRFTIKEPEPQLTRADVRSEVKDMIRRGELDRDLRRLGWRRQAT